MMGRRERHNTFAPLPLFYVAILSCLLALATLIPLPARAGITAKDVLVMVRTFAFLSTPPQGRIDLAIVFDPANAGSVSDMETIVVVLAKSADAPARPVPLPVTELNRLAAFRVALITGGVARFLPAMAQEARGRGILTMSTDQECIRADFCVMGVATEPRVEIVISHSAAQATGITFDPTFIMMISEH